jgi:serine/threonine-protein kinase
MLLDLGLAKKISGSIDGLSAKPITQLGMRVGTVEYMSPEQCLEHDVDQRADIYALGIMVFELLTGKLPFDELSIGKFLFAHVQTAPPSLRSFNPKISKAIERVVNLAIAKDPKQRPNTPMEFLQYFEEAANLSESIYKTQQNLVLIREPLDI